MLRAAMVQAIAARFLLEDKLEFIVLRTKCKVQSVKCKIAVFPSEMILISPQSGHIHFAFSILNFALFIERQLDKLKFESQSDTRLCPMVR